MKRVVLTGATGFVGQHAIAPLRECGFEIHAVGRRPPSDPDVVFHQLDLLANGGIEKLLESVKATHLLHLAWYAASARLYSSSENLKWVGATLTLLRAFAETGGRRAVLAGTCVEYGRTSSPCEEGSTPCEPRSLYGIAKDATRRVAECYASVAGLSAAWGRIFYLYGPGEKKGRLVREAIDALTAGRPFPATEGTQRRDFMHVRDTGNALAALLDSDVGGPVNIASGTAVTVRSLLETLAEITGGKHLIQFGALQLPEAEDLVIEAKIDRLLSEVGYRPVFGLTEGLTDTLKRWREESKTNAGWIDTTEGAGRLPRQPS